MAALTLKYFIPLLFIVASCLGYWIQKITTQEHKPRTIYASINVLLLVLGFGVLLSLIQMSADSFLDYYTLLVGIVLFFTLTAVMKHSIYVFEGLLFGYLIFFGIDPTAVLALFFIFLIYNLIAGIIDIKPIFVLTRNMDIKPIKRPVSLKLYIIGISIVLAYLWVFIFQGAVLELHFSFLLLGAMLVLLGESVYRILQLDF